MISCLQVAATLVGSKAAYDTPALMTGEDFAFIAEKVRTALKCCPCAAKGLRRAHFKCIIYVCSVYGPHFTNAGHGLQVPSAYMFLGIRNESLGSVHELHTPTFMLDEQVRRTGPGSLDWYPVICIRLYQIMSHRPCLASRRLPANTPEPLRDAEGVM